MSACLQMHVGQNMFVTILLDHMHASAHWDMLSTLAYKIHLIQFVLVRNYTYLFYLTHTVTVCYTGSI